MYDAVMIVDQHQRYNDSKAHNYKVDIEREAEGLNTLLKPLGLHTRRVAIVDAADKEGFVAYNRNGFETISMNGDRSEKLLSFIMDERQKLLKNPPKQMVLVSNDTMFSFLASDMANLKTEVKVWSLKEDLPPQLAPFYYCRLEDMVPGTKIQVARVDIRLDYENLHIGLEKQGWQPNPKELIEAVKSATANMGKIVSITAYADWDELSKGTDVNYQRELALLGIKTRYQVVSAHGKSSADMELVTEVHSLLERADSIDTVVIGSRDRDFRAIIEQIKQADKKAVVLALHEGLSSDLVRVADEVRYLDEYIRIKRIYHHQGQHNGQAARFTDQQTELLLALSAWMSQKRWKWITEANINEFLADTSFTQANVEQARKAELLVPWQGNANQYTLNMDQPLAKAAHILVRWSKDRIDFCLNKKGMAYVDSNYLANGMQMNRSLQELKVGQQRHNAEQWLNKLASAGILAKVNQPHPKDKSRSITTWWLPGHEPKAELTEVGKPKENLTKVEGALLPEKRPDSNNEEISEGAVIPIEPLTIDEVGLHRALDTKFNAEELRTLCFKLRIDYDSLGGEGKEGKARELVLMAKRTDQIHKLVRKIEEARPGTGKKLGAKPQAVPQNSLGSLLAQPTAFAQQVPVGA